MPISVLQGHFPGSLIEPIETSPWGLLKIDCNSGKANQWAELASMGRIFVHLKDIQCSMEQGYDEKRGYQENDRE